MLEASVYFIGQVHYLIVFSVEQEAALNSVSVLLLSQDLSSSACQTICTHLFDAYLQASPEIKEKIAPLLRRAYQLFPTATRDAAESKFDGEGSYGEQLVRKEVFSVSRLVSTRLVLKLT
jgi:hypothetical protein